ncbi:MAG: alkaline phosphatase D family protein [Acidimicrobiales bacterium]|nr:alkaline phosphatase D family protein [Acidimicrobiales bacterium]
MGDTRPPWLPLSRRAFLGVLGAGAVAACTGGSGSSSSAPSSTEAGGATPSRPPSAPPTSAAARLGADPFTLGVASGDPLPDGVVLWTRLAPEPLAPDGAGGMPARDVAVRWQVAADEAFASVVAGGEVAASPDAAHSVHVDVRGLEPGRPYWYRFAAGGFESPVARTRTAPAAGAPVGRARFAVASCQSWQSGYYTAHAAIAADEPDLVLHLGDYIYEGGVATGAVRPHDGPEAADLAGYRNRYALYKGDADLQAAHRSAPWILTWDDHEVENNYAGASPEAGNDTEGFLRRRADAYRAWWEHQPVRLPPPVGPDLAIHRRLGWGGLADLFVLDTRQYRSVQPCGRDDDLGQPCPAVDDPAATLLGAQQEAWLLAGLADADATWTVLAQQVVMTPLLLPLGFRNLDQWDGYPAARQRLVDGLVGAGVADAVVLTGDIHASGVGLLHRAPADPASPVVAVELVAPGIASAFPEGLAGLAEATLAGNALFPYVEVRRRGYLRCDVTPTAWRADVRLVDRVDVPGAPVQTDATFVVEAGVPGVTRA